AAHSWLAYFTGSTGPLYWPAPERLGSLPISKASTQRGWLAGCVSGSIQCAHCQVSSATCCGVALASVLFSRSSTLYGSRSWPHRYCESGLAVILSQLKELIAY